MKNQKVIYLMIIIVLLIAGCGVEETPAPDDSTIPVDAIFAPLTQKLGDHAGVGISNIFVIRDVVYQYTTNALLIYDAKAALKDQFRLEPLAKYWDVAEPAVPDPQDSEQIYVNGHVVWDEARTLYIELGADILGLPLTEVRYNPKHGRYEQFFENMGVYRMETDPPGQISIMPYGTWTCVNMCKPPVPDNTGPGKWPPPSQDELLQQGEAVFWAEVSRVGMQFSGIPLTPAYFASDGYIEKVFENIVMIWDPVKAGAVDLRRLPQIVGIPPSPPVPAQAMMYFFKVSGELGYNIPEEFMVYVTRHGTLARIGQPIDELHVAQDGTATRQCYENLCLLYNQTAPKNLQIRPEALGYAYLNAIVLPAEVNTARDPVKPAQITPSSQLHLTIWQGVDIVDQGESQVIGAGVFDGVQPLSGAQMSVTVHLPDGTQREYIMPLTGDDGQAQVELEPIQASKGTLIPYQVCILNLPDSQFCTGDEFVIWDGG